MSKIAETQPQSSYAAFVCVYKSKLTYFIRTIPNIRELLLPLEYAILQKFIPAITRDQICSDNERILLSLPTRYGALNISFFHETAKFEYENFRIITKQLTNLIIFQDPIYTVNTFEVSKLKVRWCRARDLFASQIPVTTGGFELRISCIRSHYLTH